MINPNKSPQSCATATTSKVKCVHPFDMELKNTEQLINELMQLMVKYEHELSHESMRPKIEQLERWLESYRIGLEAANNVIDNAQPWLQDAREKIRLAADEIYRLESEGGTPITAKQAAQAEALNKAVKRIDETLVEVEDLFCDAKG